MDFTGRFEHMHPEVHKGTHNRVCPVLQLEVGLKLMEKWALRFDETQVLYSTSFNNEIGFGSGEQIMLLMAVKEETSFSKLYIFSVLLHLTFHM